MMAQLATNSALQGLRGRLGQELVFKHYGDKTVVTAYPDMSRVKRSERQKLENNRFKEAVAYAKAVLRDPVQKAAWQEKIGAGKSVYHAALRAWLRGEV